MMTLPPQPRWRTCLVALLLGSWLFGARQPNQATRHDGAADAEGEEAEADTSADSSTDANLVPSLVGSCAGLSPFDAAAVLQEPVKDQEPIGNLIFGPLSAAFDLGQQVLYGWCGYTTATEIEADAINQAQPHLLTNLPYAHAVAADHIAFDEIALSDGTLQAGWYDLFALVEVLGAADPSYDSQALAAELREAGADAPFLDTLSMVVSADPNTTATLLPVREENPANSSLWIWQPLDDGYFSLLFSQTDAGYDLVVARLGNAVSEQTVLGYSQVILAQLANTEERAATPTSDTPTVADCEQLSVEAAEAVVGAPVVGQMVSTMWEVEPLAEVDDSTLLIYAALPTGEVRFYLFHPRAAGGLYYMAGVSNLPLDVMRIALVNAAEKLITSS